MSDEPPIDWQAKAKRNYALFQHAVRDHVEDIRDMEAVLAREGIPEDDGYGCYPLITRVEMLIAKLKGVPS